jgi:hypothetical protein
VRAPAVLVLLAVLAAGCNASPGTASGADGEPVPVLRGVVVDAAVHPIEGATVTVDGASSNVTDADGEFAFLGLAEGSHNILVEAAGYLPLAGVAAATLNATPVRLTMTAVPAPGGYNQTYRFQGFFEAGTGVASVVTERVPTDLNGTACRCTWHVTADEVVRAFVIEAVWVDNVARPDQPAQYRWHVAVESPEQRLSAYDPSPIRVEVNGGAFPEAARVFEVGLSPDSLWPAAQQDFDFAVTLFYGMSPPADFAVLAPP